MKRKKLMVIYLDDYGDSEVLRVNSRDGMTLRESLGLLEWAKMILFESVKIDNALSEYAKEEL